MRKSRGVYYTPPPVVNFIVRAVDDILKDTLRHPRRPRRPQARDRARFRLRHRHVPAGGVPAHLRQHRRAERRPADPIVREHILKNLFGFEYLIAPYTIAHLKLSQYLKDRGIR